LNSTNNCELWGQSFKVELESNKSACYILNGTNAESDEEHDSFSLLVRAVARQYFEQRIRDLQVRNYDYFREEGKILQKYATISSEFILAYIPHHLYPQLDTVIAP
jgi:hypothetical protein